VFIASVTDFLRVGLHGSGMMWRAVHRIFMLKKECTCQVTYASFVR
jgi:hypothetical protein